MLYQRSHVSFRIKKSHHSLDFWVPVCLIRPSLTVSHNLIITRVSLRFLYLPFQKVLIVSASLDKLFLSHTRKVFLNIYKQYFTLELKYIIIKVVTTSHLVLGSDWSTPKFSPLESTVMLTALWMEASFSKRIRSYCVTPSEWLGFSTLTSVAP